MPELPEVGAVARAGRPLVEGERIVRCRVVHPTVVHRLNTAEARRPHKSIVDVLQRALECSLSPAPDFRDPNWWFQWLERILRVYGREGKRCRRCGALVRQIEQGGRSTYFCEQCRR